MSPFFNLFGVFLGIGIFGYGAKIGNWWIITAGWIVIGVSAFRLGMTV